MQNRTKYHILALTAILSGIYIFVDGGYKTSTYGTYIFGGAATCFLVIVPISALKRVSWKGIFTQVFSYPVLVAVGYYYWYKDTKMAVTLSTWFFWGEILGCLCIWHLGSYYVHVKLKLPK